MAYNMVYNLTELGNGSQQIIEGFGEVGSAMTEWIDLVVLLMVLGFVIGTIIKVGRVFGDGDGWRTFLLPKPKHLPVVIGTAVVIGMVVGSILLMNLDVNTKVVAEGNSEVVSPVANTASSVGNYSNVPDIETDIGDVWSDDLSDEGLLDLDI